MKIHEIITEQGVAEAFDKPYKGKWEHGDDGHDMLVRLPDGSNLSIMFSLDYGAYGDEEWTVEFWRGNSQEVTGEGDQQRIFATVLSAIQKFINKYHPERLRFSANKDVEPGQKSMSRTNLYNKLVQRYANSWGYEVDVDDFADTTVYNLYTMNEDVAEGKQPGQPVVDAILQVMPAAQEIWFHGSRATGRHRKNSDTDILVVVPDNLVGDKYLGAVRILQKLNSNFNNYDIQPTKTGTNIHRIAQEEGRLLWSKQGVAENFADGKVKGKSRPGRVKRAGASCAGSVSSLRQRAKNASGEKAKMYHWCANMKSGRNK